MSCVAGKLRREADNIETFMNRTPEQKRVLGASILLGLRAIMLEGAQEIEIRERRVSNLLLVTDKIKELVEDL